MIKLRKVWKRYHHHIANDWVLKNIHLTFPKKVSVGLIGQNGAGKSTLLSLIAGMDSPSRGQIYRNCSVSWPIGLSGGMHPMMTGRQNVKFVARVHGSDNIEQIIDFVQDFAEIGAAFDEPVSTYSSGMGARLRFGLSLAFDFDFYLSDEATAVGDRDFRKKAEAAFKKRIGKSSLIIVSHSEGILKELCQAGVWLHKGRAYWFDDIHEAIANYHKHVDNKDKLK